MSSLDFNDALPLCLAPNTKTLGRVVQPLWSSEPCPSRAALGRDKGLNRSPALQSPVAPRGSIMAPGMRACFSPRKSVRI
jgi:hypothetical protein